ncbi:PREDICTED: probable LRR receptor-like serine/threonine-protein kinase At1g53440 isoform X2 [Nelumbo nucifera]|uniref:non-specific serine/threonine protein kinase n=1 Tax=Nelumbo nucifera TaxID=4432 RepID=A0A1U7ZG31_NELNU|nr:PREDICTED: probable LRR receptor-like serine/threonine-protein kinase At1g53440 isoform X2 [Nelumbo nucifera]
MAVLADSSKILSALLCFLVLNCFAGFRSEARVLPDEEVQALRKISAKLNNKYWTIKSTSCSGGFINSYNYARNIISNITCDCSYNAFTVCHITKFKMEGMNLTGILPDEFGDLPYLTEIDLIRNYINGTIPVSWTRIPLVTINLIGNRISGSIPAEFGSVETLEELVLEDNQLGGTLPPQLGNLTRLRRLLLSANNITGPLPETFGKLKNLTDFRIDGNSISGRIPNFIGNWTKINILNMQGTSLEGPIPSEISFLTNLIQLRVSDLNGSNMSFPDLSGMKSITDLILRNCMITGQIPDYISEMKNIIRLYLTNNSLTGSVPSWIIDNKKYIDISYNNFTGYSPQPGCEQTNVKTVASYSSPEGNLVNWCLKKDLSCSSKPRYHSLFINCGGPKVVIHGEEYEEDLSPMSSSAFHASNERWACSTTGDYLYSDPPNFKVQANTALNVTDSELYSTARLSPLSLKYYGLCLRKGSYTVKLHFAEIIYTEDRTFSSLGERIFDVLIQGEIRLKDFNIAKEANGVGKSNIQEFKDVFVDGSTLEIHLYWSGKGTTAIPDRGVYGPLISAITVTPNFNPDTGLSVGAIVGIVAAACVVLILILVTLRMNGYLGRKDLEDNELGGLEIQSGYFSLKQIKSATGNFDPENKIGEGGFGPVYKGILPDGTVIAVKQLSSKSKQGSREFLNEIGMISALQHPNLVKLFGCCVEGNQLLLIYEYMENNSLARALFGSEEHRLELNWPVRRKICLGIARGLAYLHEESRLKIVHRDIKATNVLLDKDLNAKISDFGLAKLDEEGNTHISTRIAGTIGYMAPEYAMRGYLTDKADVYSFGVVLLEIVSGKSNTSYRPKEDFVYLLDWAYVLQEEDNLLELVDPTLESRYSKEEALRMLSLALLCTGPSPFLRPTMSSVVSMLEGKIPVQAPLNQSSMNDELRLRAFEKFSQDSQSYISGTSQESWVQKSISADDPRFGSTTSFPYNEENEHQSDERKLIHDVNDISLN